MATGEVISGRGSIRMGGRVYPCSNIDVSPATETREPVVSMTGVVGMSATPVAPTVTATLLITPSVRVQTINEMVNETVEVSYAAGRSYILEGCTTTEPLSHSATDANGDVTMAGVTCTERT